MKHILLLKGNIQTGKSTIILNNIKHIPKCHLGGFLCQRLTKEGKTKAFRLIPAQTSEAITLNYSLDMPNIFLEEISGKWIKNESVFTSEGIEFLSDLSSKKLIVLDEIGGFELLSDKFREKLYEVLQGDIPVLGVIKSHNNGIIMKNAVGLKNDYWNYYENLYKNIENLWDGKILNVDKSNILYIDDEIKAFLKTYCLT